MTTKPRVLVVADVRGWAWDRKARAYARLLSGEFAVTVHYSGEAPLPLLGGAFDLVHLFEVSQLDRVPEAAVRGGPRVVAGLTAHVWRTWGPARMLGWAGRCSALHGNSLLIAGELEQFHPRVRYLPNGVDAGTFRPPDVPRAGEVVFGHVGKPSPRKGGGLVVGAARRAGVRLLVNQRTSRLALPEAEMAAFYRGVDVEVAASSMDGTPNPMLEAAASGAALLSTPIGNMPELIRDGVNGHLLPELPGREEGRPPVLPGDEAALACLTGAMTERMEWFREHPAEAREMGRRAREDVLGAWTWERQVPRVAELWREVLGGGGI